MQQHPVVPQEEWIAARKALSGAQAAPVVLFSPTISMEPCPISNITTSR